MGSGKGGGGGGGRVGGGGGAEAVLPGGGSASGGLQPGEQVPPYQPPWYSDLPPVLNENRRLNANGEVIVGAKGALPTLNRFDKTKAGEEAAREWLINEVGLPGHLAHELHSRDMAGNVANMLPDGAEYLGHGIEGLGIAVSGTKAVRVQYDGQKPLPAYNVGRSGVYSDWMKKYGNVWVEQKERIQYTASQATRAAKFRDVNIGEKKTQMVESFIKDVRGTTRAGRGIYTRNKPADWADVDMHNGNWGFDFAGRPRVFDQGAVRPFWDQRYKAGS